MNLPDVNRLAGEVVSGDDFGIQARAPEYRQREPSQSNNNAAAALEVVLNRPGFAGGPNS